MSGFYEKYGPWAIVTGASAGIGAEFARQIAARGMNIVLTARRARKLEEVAAELRQQHGVEVKTVAVDLTRRDFIETIRESTEGLDVGLLVNNAGTYITGRFLENDLESELASIDLNVRAPVILAREYGSRMVEKGRGGIIFLASTVAIRAPPTRLTMPPRRPSTCTSPRAWPTSWGPRASMCWPSLPGRQ